MGSRRVAAFSAWATSPSEKGPLFEPANSKVYRHPTFYEIPEEVGHM